MEGKDSWTTRQPRFDTSNHTDASEFHCSKGVMIPTRAVMIANTKVRMNRHGRWRRWQVQVTTVLAGRGCNCLELCIVKRSDTCPCRWRGSGS